MDFRKYSCEDFIQRLASGAPVPGGGGASALMGAIGVALGNMVGSLTLGKKKYADVQDDIVRLKAQADGLQASFLHLITQDAEAFAPLAQAYGLPQTTEEEKTNKRAIMESALRNACAVPLQIMERCCEAIRLIEAFTAKGTAIAISDAGCGAACCRAALTSASMNVFVNTKLMSDRAYAEDVNRKTDRMLAEAIPLCDAVVQTVSAAIR